MPTYEYTCKACGEHLEVVQSFQDDPLTTCPACGGVLRKVFGSIGIAFKGSGFYKTDSRSSSSAAKTSSSAPATSESSGSSGSSGSDSSPSSPPKSESSTPKSDTGSSAKAS